MGLDCQVCDEILKKERGCYDESLVAWRIDNEVYRRCPKKLVPLGVYECLKAYNLFQKGLLPNYVNWLYESNKFIDIMLYIEGEMSIIEQEKLNKRKKHA